MSAEISLQSINHFEFHNNKAFPLAPPAGQTLDYCFFVLSCNEPCSLATSAATELLILFTSSHVTVWFNLPSTNFDIFLYYHVVLHLFYSHVEGALYRTELSYGFCVFLWLSVIFILWLWFFFVLKISWITMKKKTNAGIAHFKRKEIHIVYKRQGNAFLFVLFTTVFKHKILNVSSRKGFFKHWMKLKLEADLNFCLKI